MNQGAARHALAERGNDLYETPPVATRALIRLGILPPVIWEPACGPGAIVRELREAGHDVIATDLVDYGERRCPDSASGVDFLLEHVPQAHCIVTNPPYKLADDFVRHGLKLGCTVVVLLRLMALEGERRSDIVDGHLWQVFAGRERLPMMHRDGWAGAKIGNSGAPFAWFVFRPERKRTPTIELRRISWREGA